MSCVVISAERRADAREEGFTVFEPYEANIAGSWSFKASACSHIGVQPELTELSDVISLRTEAGLVGSFTAAH